jgi:hypothetical protein
MLRQELCVDDLGLRAGTLAPISTTERVLNAKCRIRRSNSSARTVAQ